MAKKKANEKPVKKASKKPVKKANEKPVKKASKKPVNKASKKPVKKASKKPAKAKPAKAKSAKAKPAKATPKPTRNRVVPAFIVKRVKKATPVDTWPTEKEWRQSGLCSEAQADGIPCTALGRNCEICERADQKDSHGG